MRLLPLAAALLLTACAAPSPGRAGATAPTTAPTTSYDLSLAAATPRVTKVLIVIEENHSLDEARRSMPYLASLAQRYAYATHYRAITHPSLPNYLAIAGGLTFGVTDDADPAAHPVAGPSIFGQAIALGGTAKIYGDASPGPCTTTSQGRFAVKHTPWPYFTDERAQCRRGDVGLGGLAADARAGHLPTVSMVIPDLDHDAHDGTLAAADTWLRGTLGPVLAGNDFRSGRLAVVVTSDEDDHSQGNTVLTVVMHRSLHGEVVRTPLTHYSLTGFVDHVLGAPALRQAHGAPSLARAFGLA